MKKTFLLIMGLVVGTVSFAQESNSQTISASVEPQVHLMAMSSQKVRLFVQPEASKGKIALLDEEGHSLFTETVALHEGINQQFDIAQLATGKYRLKITTDGGTVIKTFIIQPVTHERSVVLES